MFSTGNLTFVAGLLLAQGVLIYSYPKRKLFWARVPAAIAVCLLLAYFFPSPKDLIYNPYYSLLRFAVLFGYTFAGAAFCFNCGTGAVFAACVGGYALQHISYHCYSMLSLIDWFPAGWWTELLICLALCVIAFLTVGRYAAKKYFYEYYSPRMVWISGITILICVGLSRFGRLSRGDTITAVCTSLYAITCCVLVLVLQYFVYNFAQVKAEKETQRRLAEEERKQYEISKTNMELLNIKCHDVKQRLESGRLADGERESLAELIGIYDETVKTGLEGLDVILNEKAVQCRRQGIKFTFLGDGACLAFMNAMDVYSLFGNALSNAVEAVEKVDDPEKKTISITIEKKGDLVLVNVVNWFSGGFRRENGLPVTTKKSEIGFHGYGMKSIRNVAQKYRGDIAITTDGGVFGLSVYLLNDKN